MYLQPNQPCATAILIASLCIANASALAAPLRVMPVGDSITRGLNWGGAEPGGYRTRLYDRVTNELFVEEGVAFVGTQSDNPDPGRLPDPFHEGRGGWRIDEHFATIETAIAEFMPGLVLLHLGTNDIDQNFQLETAAERLDRLIGQILSASPQTQVLVAQIINSTNLIESAEIQAYNAALPAIVDARRSVGQPVSLANLYSVVSNPSNYWNDRGVWDTYHPNDAGYDQLADGWYTAIAGLNADVGGLKNPEDILVGDYSGNGEIDAADYTVWRNALDTTTPLPNDPLGGEIGLAQYRLWKSMFGLNDEVAGNGVPEPVTGRSVFAVVGTLAALLHRVGAVRKCNSPYLRSPRHQQ